MTIGGPAAWSPGGVSSSAASSSSLSGGSADVIVRNAVGLANLGNTCFLNSAVQCLCSTETLLDYFKKVSENPSMLKTQSKLVQAFSDTINSIRTSPPNSIIRPSALRNNVVAVAKQFDNYEQHDSQELLRFLMSGLHDHLNRVTQMPKYEQIVDQPGDSDQVRATRWWKNYTDRNDSIIADSFAGQLKSEIICQKCQNSSLAFDPFWDLSLPIPKPPKKSSSGVALSADGSDHKCTLKDCFEEFTTQELLTDDDVVYCSKCKKHRECTKQLSIYRLPPYLCLHLKRFSFKSSGRFKLQSVVSFPTVLDLSEYMPETDNNTYKYVLYAVSNHSGSSSGGHYIAYANIARANVNGDGEKWYNFNDARATACTAKDVKSTQAYVLFYKRLIDDDANEVKVEEDDQEDDDDYDNGKGKDKERDSKKKHKSKKHSK
jgi:ubiquitin C-terminal hydrolase